MMMRHVKVVSVTPRVPNINEQPSQALNHVEKIQMRYEELHGAIWMETCNSVMRGVTIADVAAVSAKHWDGWKSDCSGFVRAVTTERGVPLTGNANQMVDELSRQGNEWFKLGSDPQSTQDYANRGFLANAGLKAKRHGHVAIIVPTPHAQRYPVGYWGQYGGTGRRNTTINWSWNRDDLSNVLCQADTMKRRVSIFVSPLIAMLMASSVATADSCDFTALTITGSVVTNGSMHITLGEADNLDHPSAWSGPIRISLEGQPACVSSEPVSIVEAPLLVTGDMLFVPTYSGSQRRVYALDIKTCRVLWKSSVYFADPIFRSGVLMIGNSGIHLNESCRPVTLAEG